MVLQDSSEVTKNAFKIYSKDVEKQHTTFGFIHSQSPHQKEELPSGEITSLIKERGSRLCL